MSRIRYLALVTVVLASCNKSSPPAAKRLPLSAAPVTQAENTSKDDPRKKSQRKDIIVLTPRAAAHVRQLLQSKEYRYLRVSVVNDQYKLHLEERMDPKEDYLGESRGVPIVVDRKSSTLLPAGITVDFLDEAGETGFKFDAPKIAQADLDTSLSLAEARRGFKTKLSRRETGKSPVPQPPPDVFRLIHYKTPAGKLAAYLTPDPKDGAKHPAIIWITGGDCNSIDAGCWRESAPGNDQSASAYRKAGIVMMFPALRGGNDNPGVKEGFFGEVDDILAAASFLRDQPFVDPERIYLGGHSTGGTLVFLTAECSDCFRAVFSFGPVEDVLGYGPQYNPFVLSDRKELRLRAPGRWLHSIRVPVFVFEGTGGNLSSLQAMANRSKNPKVRFFAVKGTDHFGVLAPTNRLIAEKVLRDTGPTCALTFTEEEVNKPFLK